MAALTKYEMIMNGQGLVVNAFRDAPGRGDYFSGSSGTSEGQFLYVLGMLDAYQVTGNKKSLDQANRALSHILTTLYRKMPIPAVVTDQDIFAPHWLFAVKYEFNSAVIHYDLQLNFVNGVAYIGSDVVRKVFNARSLDGVYLWQNPYAVLVSGTMYDVASTEYVAGTGQKVTLTTPYNGQLLVTYSTADGPVIGVNEPYEAWPDWRLLDNSEIDAACDVFIWAWRAFQLAYEITGNTSWRDAARATVEQAAIAMDINDGRDWVKPTWTDSPFADGARFSYADRLPAPAFGVGAYGVVEIGIPSFLSGTGEVQYGKASIGDTYAAGDYTTIEIGASRNCAAQFYIDLYQQYSEANRYFVNLALVATTSTALQTFTLQRTDFKNSSGAVLPAGSPIYTAGVATRESFTYTVWLKRVRQSPPRDIAYYPGAIPFTANFLGNPPMLIDWRGPVYAGYQAPPMWGLTGNRAAELTCTQLLRDAQTAWVSNVGGARGPFAPVFYFNRDDAVQYGPKNTFGWEGPDPNTIWGGYQYRPLAELAETVFDSTVVDELYNTAALAAEQFLTWLNNTSIWPVAPVRGPPTDFPITGAEYNYDEPHMAALIWRTAMKLDWKRRILNGEYSTINPVHLALSNRTEAFFDKLWITSGVMAGTFSQNPDEHEWYGFWHGEIMSTIATAYRWALLPQVNKPALAAKCLVWLNGMTKWAVENSGRVESVWGNRLWPFDTDWAGGMSETWEYSTNIITSYDGSEQRLSKRLEPRRTVKLNHTLITQADTSDYQSILQSRQNKPALLPQWHLSSKLAVAGNIGDSILTLAAAPDTSAQDGAMVVFSYKGQRHITWLRWVDGTTITINDELPFYLPAGSPMAPASNAIIDTDASSSRQTATTTQVALSFLMLPQEDLRTLPDSAPVQTFTVGTDVREVITHKPNWSTALTIDDQWTYDVLNYDDGPVTPMEGENSGRRTVKANFSFLNVAQRTAFEGLLKRLRGRQKACWVPAWTRDFELAADATALNAIRVTTNAAITESLITKPFIGLAIHRKDGSLWCVRVNSFVTAGTTTTLTLDRNTASLVKMAEVTKISLLYRVRQASDSAEITWLTDKVAECSVSFITVQE